MLLSDLGDQHQTGHHIIRRKRRWFQGFPLSLEQLGASNPSLSIPPMTLFPTAVVELTFLPCPWEARPPLQVFLRETSGCEGLQGTSQNLLCCSGGNNPQPQSICGEGCELVTVPSSARVVFRLPAPGRAKFPACKAESSSSISQVKLTPAVFRACNENWCLGKVYKTQETAGEIGPWGENAHFKSRACPAAGILAGGSSRLPLTTKCYTSSWTHIFSWMKQERNLRS